MKQKNKLLFSSILVLILVTILSSATVFAETTDSWTLKTAMNEARRLHQEAVVNGKVYVIGGYAAGKAGMNSVEEYDPSTNAWTTKAPMKEARYLHVVVVVNNKIYAIGGMGLNGLLKSVEEYNPQTNAWTKKADMLSNRSDFQVAVVGDKIYVIGGTDAKGTYLKTVEEYDPETDSWTAKKQMSTERVYCKAAVVDNKIYVIGGYTSNGYVYSLEVYDPGTNTWITRSSMNNKTVRNELAVVNGKIYSIGGINSQYATNYVEEYDPVADTWTNKAAMANARDQIKIAIVNNKIYAIGGRAVTSGNITNYLNVVEEYDADSNTWTNKAPMNIVRSNASPVQFDIGVVGNTIYATGGYDNNSKDVSSVEAYTVGGSSTNEPDPPVITGNSGILELTITNGTVKEYDLIAAELQSFLTWYDARANGADKAYYIFTKKNNIKPFLSRKEYIAFDKISSFEVKEYAE